MTQSRIKSLTVEQLVERFVAVALDQDEAELQEDTRKFRPLYEQMEAVEQELKSRFGDQRRALLPLHNHLNAQVRLKAAPATLAVAPDTAHCRIGPSLRRG